jgi:hypothetical protein
MTKRCEICGTRPMTSGRNDSLPYCDPCATEADWENVHSDNGHDDEEAVANGWDTAESVAACWICHPELNEAAKDYTPRTGTSRTDAARTTHRSHAGCDHARTPKARAACRKAGGPKVN